MRFHKKQLFYFVAENRAIFSNIGAPDLCDQTRDHSTDPSNSSINTQQKPWQASSQNP
jgi:hypothetical protein